MPLRLLLSALILIAAVAPLSPTDAQAPDDEAGPPATLISPVAGGWTLLVNLGDAGPPAAVLGLLRDFVTAAFARDDSLRRFRTYRPGFPGLSDLAEIAAGQPFWVRVPADRLQDDLYLWEQPATQADLAVPLRPGFNLVPWTGTDGLSVSAATAGIAVRRAYLWDLSQQRYRVWGSDLPPFVRDDFELEYGAAIWLDLAGSMSVTWEQS